MIRKLCFKRALSQAAVFALYLTGFAGCGGENAPPSGAQAASGTSGDPKAGATAADAQTDKSAASAPVAAKPPEPSKPVIYSASELAKVIDFTKLPRIPGTKVGRGGPAHLSLQVPGKVTEVAAFYFEALAKLGWRKSGGPGEQPPTDEYAAATLLKDGHTVSLSIFKGGEKNESSVTLISHGNFDTRTLPRGEGTKLTYESSTSTIFFTPTKVPEETDRVLKAFEADGWQSYDRMHSGKPAKSDDQRFLKLRKRGYTLDVMIVVAPAQHNETSVQYNVQALSHELPTPPEAAQVEFDDDRWELKCTVPGDFKTAAEFYRKTMPEIGDKPLPSEDPQDTYWNLRFGTEGGDIVLVQAQSKDGKTTNISITGVSAEALAEMKKREGEKPAEAK